MTREAHACAVDHREVCRHVRIEPDEAVVEDGNGVLGDHALLGGHAPTLVVGADAQNVTSSITS